MPVAFPPQIETLIHYLSDDPREGVKAQALDDLCHLARERPHLWDTASVDVSPHLPRSFFVLYIFYIFLVFLS